MSKIWGIPSPYKSGAQKRPFWTTSQLNGNYNGLLSSKQHNTRASALQTTRGLLHRLKTTWNLVHKRLQITHPPQILHSTSLPGFADGDQPTELELCVKRWMVNRAKHMQYRSRGRPSLPKTFTFIRFLDDFETWWRISAEWNVT